MATVGSFAGLAEAVQVLKDSNWASIQELVISLPYRYQEWWMNLYRESPAHILVETCLVLFVLWLLFIRRTVDPVKTSDVDRFTDKEVAWLVDTWEPEPLVSTEISARDQRRAHGSKLVVEAINGNYLTVAGIDTPVLNLGSYDFLNQGENKATKQDAEQTLLKYGVGSCGPRGFYGTIDLHLKFEEEIAKHMGTQEAISYSDGASAVSSTITAFAKRGDLLLVDEACGEPVRTGAGLSRGRVHYFKHNDMQDLRTVMSSIAADDKRLKRDSSQQRRFVIVEGLYKKTGNICPLDELMKLKEEYCYRIILDESLSFGCLGATGKGVTELFNIPVADVEMLIIGMGSSLASVGGVSLGTREVVDHQRLSGPGYCFSASAPPVFSTAALCSLAVLQDKSQAGKLLTSLQKNCSAMRDELSDVPGLSLVTEGPNPILHLSLDPSNSAVAAALSNLSGEELWDMEEAIIFDIVNKCIDNGVGVTFSVFQSDWIQEFVKSDSVLRPSLRVCVSSKLLSKEIKNAAKVLKEVTNEVLGSGSKVVAKKKGKK